MQEEIKMKRLASLAFVLVLLLALASCAGAPTTSASPTGAATPPSTTAATTPAAPPATPATGAPSLTETASPADTGGPQYGGTLTIQYSDFNTVFDPAMGEQYTYSLWLEYLFGMDWGLNDPSTFSFSENTFNLNYASGQIAKSWNWDPVKMDFTVTIRDDVYFQQKDPQYDIFHERKLTADDVKYSYDRVTGRGSGFDENNYIVIDGDWRPRLDMLTSIEVTGPDTLVFHLNTASETKLSELVIAQINITGPEWDKLTDTQKADWHYACGTGPYILTDYVPDNHYTFTRNDNYYATDERHPENKLPYLDGITLQKFGDSTSMISSFISGNLDYISIVAGLSASETQQIKDNAKNASVQSFPYSAPAIALKVNQSPFSDPNVRIAMQKAINLQEVNSAYFGLSDFTYAGLWSPALKAWSAVGDWDATLQSQYSYDPAGAKQLLTDAGYANGFEFTVSIDPMANTEVFQLAKSYLAAVGITMDIEVLPDMMAGRQVQGDSSDPRMFNFDLGSSFDPGFAFQTFATTGFAYSIYHGDTHMDDLLAATRDAMTLDDQSKAAKAADLYFMQQHWLIALSGLTSRDAFVSPALGGLQNGEQFQASHFFKTIATRIWDNKQ